jgi:tetratricopeptide (TPR) repeat protein
MLMISVILRTLLIYCLILLFTPNITSAGLKTFIKEYSYQASEDDSRNSSRVIALREVKRLLLEELGTYLESETEVRNFQLTQDQITTLTAGIVQTELLEEKWDGRVYWLKSKITADSDSVVQSIDALRKDRDKTKELEAMRQKSDELLREVERLRKEMVSSKDGSREAQKAVYDRSIKQLSAAGWIEKGHAVQGRHDDFKGAVEAFSRAIELDPTNIKAYYFRARISEKNQEMSDYYKILSIEAKTTEDHLVRAWTYKELDQRDAAFQEFGKAIEKARDNKEKAYAYFDRGRYYFLFRPRAYVEPSDKDIPDALELTLQDFSQAIALDPTEPSYFHNRANCYLGIGKHDLAIADFTAGIQLDPNNAGLFSGRGQVYERLRKPELAVADLSRAIELEGPDDLFAGLDFMMRANLYEELGKLDLAVRDWHTLIKRKQDDAYYYRKRGELYGRLGKYDQAIKDYNKAIALEPKGSAATVAYYGRALAYARKGDSKKAIQDLTKAIRLDPGYKNKARNEAEFGSIQNRPDFIKLIEE